MAVKWSGPKPADCDICEGKLVDSFIDGKTTYGSWSIMCGHCHTIYGKGFGKGKGQMYHANSLLKILG